MRPHVAETDQSHGETPVVRDGHCPVSINEQPNEVKPLRVYSAATVQPDETLSAARRGDRPWRKRLSTASDDGLCDGLVRVVQGGAERDLLEEPREPERDDRDQEAPEEDAVQRV